MSVASAVATLLETLRVDAGETAPAPALLGKVLVDSQRGHYPGGIDAEGIRAQGVELVDMHLVNPEQPELHDPVLVVRALLDFAGARSVAMPD